MQLVPTALRGESGKRLWQGAIAGAVIMTAVGFNWFGYGFGWVTGGTANKMESAAVTASMVPMCADKFGNAPAEAMTEFKVAKDNYDKSDVVKKYVKQVGSVDMDYTFMSNCVDEIIKRSASLKKAEQKS